MVDWTGSFRLSPKNGILLMLFSTRHRLCPLIASSLEAGPRMSSFLRQTASPILPKLHSLQITSPWVMNKVLLMQQILTPLHHLPTFCSTYQSS